MKICVDQKYILKMIQIVGVTIIKKIKTQNCFK